MSKLWKIGELARRTGLTVRTLHHYDAIDLLSPGGRTDTLHGVGHRLYTAADVARLQQIVSLKSLGFTLEQIRDALTREAFQPRDVVRRHREFVRQQLDEQRRLFDRLSALADVLDRAESPTVEDLLATIEEITMFETYYTKEQREQLEARRQQVGEARIQEVQEAWPRLMAAMQAEMEKGTDPADPAVQALAKQWKELVAEFTGGDPGLAKSLGTMYQNKDRVHGMDVAGMRPMFEYVQKAWEAAKG